MKNSKKLSYIQEGSGVELLCINKVLKIKLSFNPMYIRQNRKNYYSFILKIFIITSYSFVIKIRLSLGFQMKF